MYLKIVSNFIHILVHTCGCIFSLLISIICLHNASLEISHTLLYQVFGARLDHLSFFAKMSYHYTFMHNEMHQQIQPKIKVSFYPEENEINSFLPTSKRSFLMTWILLALSVLTAQMNKNIGMCVCGRGGEGRRGVLCTYSMIL